MKRSLWLPALVVLVAACGTTKRAMTPEERVKRGEFLVNLGGCNDCHTPMKFDPALGVPVPDFSRRLSGHPEGGPEPEGTVGGHDIGLIGPTFTSFALPFGKVYSRNLTPDKDTGLGNWTEAQFIQTMRTGRSMGVGRPLLPPMPWQNLSSLSDEDLGAMFAYLHSVPAIRNPIPTPAVPPQVVDSFGKLYEKMISSAERGAAPRN